MIKFKKIIAAAVATAAMALTTSVCASANAFNTASDSQFLNDVGVCGDRWGAASTAFHWESVSETVDSAWAKAGITSVTKPVLGNAYYIKSTGKEVTRSEALEYAAKYLGKNINIDKYFTDSNRDMYR